MAPVVGFPRTKEDIDFRAGTLATQLRNLMTDIKRFGELLNQGNDAYFISLGYDQESVDYLQAAFTDLYELQRIYNGQASLQTPKNYHNSSLLLMGVQ